METEEEILLSISADRAHWRTQARAMAASTKRGDLAGFMSRWIALTEGCQHYDVTRSAYRRCAAILPTIPEIPAACRGRALEFWIERGPSMRLQIDDDLLLADFLRGILPPYRGSAKRLYRGDSLMNRRNRTYGLSWSTDIGIGRQFATGSWINFRGGSVLLETDAPAEAIVARVPMSADCYGEREYLVDRRRLAGVRVVERFAQPAGVAANLRALEEVLS